MAGKHSRNPCDSQKKLKDTVEPAQGKETNPNQDHNSKKVSLGPNTNR